VSFAKDKNVLILYFAEYKMGRYLSNVGGRWYARGMSWRIFWCLLGVKGVLAIGWILYSGVGLVPDEAQYWTWSQALDWGYYSKPPGIAWQMGLGTALLGNTELGVRFVAVLISMVQAWLVVRLALACGLEERKALYAGVVMAFVPLGVMGSLMATTDGGLVLFWTWGVLYLVSRERPNPYVLGGILGCGALFKWPIYLLWLFAWPRCPGRDFIGGIAISLLGLVPSLIWNAGHEWGTFQHVWATVVGQGVHDVGTTPLARGNVWSFLGAQVTLLSPILFGLLILSGWQLRRTWKSIPSPLRLCGRITFSLLILYTSIACFKKMQGNWCVFVYPTGIVLLCWFCSEKWLKRGLALSMVMVLFLLTTPVPYSMSPFRHQLGWHALPQILTKSGYDPNQHFLFGDKYQMSSLLSFYGPEQKRAYFLNLHGIRKNQFSFWPSMQQERVGQTGYYLLAENTSHLDHRPTENLLAPYFGSVTFMGEYPLVHQKGKPIKQAIVFRCEGYNGKLPVDSEKY